MLEHGDGRILDHCTDEALAAAGDDQVDVLVELEQLRNQDPVGGLHQLHGRRVDVRLAQGFSDERRNGLVGMDRLFAAAEDDGVAALEAQRGRVAGDVDA